MRVLNEIAVMEISDYQGRSASGNGIWVVDAATDKRVCLPSRHCEVMHRRVTMPAWLYRKIRGGKA